MWRAASWARARAAAALAGLAGGALSPATRPAAAPRSGLLEGVVARPVEDLPEGRRVVVDLEDGTRISIFEREARVALLAGDRIRFRTDARPPAPPGIEGEPDRARYLAGRGIDLEGTAEPPGVSRVDAPPVA